MWRLTLLLLAAVAGAQQPGSMSFPTYLEGLEALAEGDYASAEALRLEPENEQARICIGRDSWTHRPDCQRSAE